jgi:membrane associated rhomboid family serine protease
MARTRRTCTVCGKPALYKCKYCGDTLCKSHLQPEMHWCVGLEAYKRDLAARGTSAIPLEFQQERRGFGRDKSSYKKPLWGIFAGNYSFLLLFLISISFVVQLLVPAYTEYFKLVPALVTARPWTLVTHIFLHSTQHFQHFLFNMLFFVFFGPVLERKIGSSKFLMVFFISGIVAGIGWSITTSNPFVAVVGASGALSGIFATLAVLMPRMKVYLFFFIPLEMWLTVILFALIDFAMMGSGDMIAHTAHLSGLFFGLFVGMLLKGSPTRL